MSCLIVLILPSNQGKAAVDWLSCYTSLLFKKFLTVSRWHMWTSWSTCRKHKIDVSTKCLWIRFSFMCEVRSRSSLLPSMTKHQFIENVKPDVFIKKILCTNISYKTKKFCKSLDFVESNNLLALVVCIDTFSRSIERR